MGSKPRTKQLNLEWVSVTTLTPAVLTGNVDDYAPTGLHSNAAIRIDPNGVNRTVSGIAAPPASHGNIRLLVVNLSATNTIQFLNEDGASAAANRFVLPTGAAWTLTAGSCVELFYDVGTARWRAVQRA